MPFFCGFLIMAKTERLNDIVAPAVEAVGFEFLGLEYIAAGKHSILRLYIDSPNGINVDDCATVSRQVSAVMDVEDPISNEYRLEVSSPGTDRPLFTAEQFAAFIGEDAQIKLYGAIDGRRNFRGEIKAVNEEKIEIEVDGETISFVIEQVEKANIIAKW